MATLDLKAINARLSRLTANYFDVRVNGQNIMIQDPDGRRYEGTVEQAMGLIDTAEAGMEPDYRSVDCVKCGRMRVEKNGVCEKCHWDNDRD